LGRPVHLHWQPWDPYLGDPSQEEQGLHSVFDTDATLALILEYNSKLKAGTGHVMTDESLE
jgi:mannan endo-1,4-beta-mannosidase